MASRTISLTMATAGLMSLIAPAHWPISKGRDSVIILTSSGVISPPLNEHVTATQ
jgi:hypothetical protein